MTITGSSIQCKPSAKPFTVIVGKEFYLEKYPVRTGAGLNQRERRSREEPVVDDKLAPQVRTYNRNLDR